MTIYHKFYYKTNTYIYNYCKEMESIINEFIKEEFSIKKVKNNKRKWVRAIVISQSYIRKTTKIYELKNFLNYSEIKNDMTQILMNVFGCNHQYAKNLINNYIKQLKI